MIFDNGFTDWPELLATPACPTSPSSRSRSPTAPPARSWSSRATSSARCTSPDEQLIAREGAPVGFYNFGDTGEAVAFLAEALRSLMQREPTASVALITRYPQQADVYYDALRIAEVPKLRRVGRQDFSFTPGIDVTDVRQVKGLEFDYVVILEPTSQNYPEVVESRHLLHIAATRAAHQLWLVCVGPVSKLIPDEVILASE
jgi:DNA helicase-2/ATP-dependent DNA helicase PcrA